MTRNLVILLAIAMVGALLLFYTKSNEEAAKTGKQVADNRHLANDAPATTDDRVERIKAATIVKYGANIEWLTFSEAEYAEERSILREHYAKIFEKDEDISKQRIRIQIARADLNGDGKPEIIWKIVHPFYSGASTSATLGISYYDGDTLKHVMHFPITWAPIGLRLSDTSNWKELIVDDKLYRWDGKRYSFVEEPVETLSEERYFKVTKDKDKGYTVTVFDEEKHIVAKFRHIKEPRVTMVNEDILRVSVIYSGKTEPSYEYYDRRNERMSNMYDNVLEERGDQVIYADGNRLIIRNMFDKNAYYKELVRDFAPVTPPRKALLEVEWEKPDRIVVKYLAGEERKVISEEIDLD